MTKELRFILNGCLATGVHTFVVFYIVQGRSGDPAFANAIAFLMATGVSYLANTLWTFKTKHSGVILMRYLIVACMGSVFSYLIAAFCAALGLVWWMGVVTVVAVMPVLTWLAHSKWTYAQ